MKFQTSFPNILKTIIFLTYLSYCECLKVPTKPGDPCDPIRDPCNGVPDTECVLTEQGISSYYCKCNNGLVTDRNNGRCILPPVKPGDACAPDVATADCSQIPLTDCAPDSTGNYICKCEDNYATVPPGRCLLLPQMPGSECHPVEAPCTSVVQTECSPLPGAGDEYFCKCTDDLVTDIQGQRCLTKPVDVGDSCHLTLTPCDSIDSTECRLQADGHDFACLCVNDLVTDVPFKRCILVPKLPGDACEITVAPCTGVTNTTCVTDLTAVPEGSYCNCITDYVTDIEGGRCLKIPTKPGQSCEPGLTDTYCASVTGATTCSPSDDGVTHFCKCDDKNEATDLVGEVCLKIPALPGDSCNEVVTPCDDIRDTTCTTENGLTYCKCDAPLVTDMDGHRCLTKPTQAGQTCDPVLTPCTDIAGTECSPNDNGGNWCKCVGDLVTDVNNGICLRVPTLPGDRCDKVIADCTLIAETTCEESKNGESYCTCIPPFVTDLFARRCLEMPTLPGMDCDPLVAPCTDIPFASECLFNFDKNRFLCQCDSEHVNDFENDRCIPYPKQPWDECIINLKPDLCDQVTNTTCEGDSTSARCICDGDYITDPDHQICILAPKFPGDLCHPIEAPCPNGDDTTCQLVHNSFICKCDDPLITDPNGRRCVAKPNKPGQVCVPGLAPCLDDQTECKFYDGRNDYFCICNAGLVTHFDEERCITVPSKPGDECIIGEDLCDIVTNTTCVVECTKAQCTCIGDFITDPDHGVCILEPKYPGDLCHPTRAPCDDVSLSDTTCQLVGHNFICECNTPLITDPNGHRCLAVPEKPGQLCDPIVAPCRDVPQTKCDYFDSKNDYYCICEAGHVTDFQQQRCLALPEKPGDECLIDLDLCSLVTNTTCSNVNVNKAICKCIEDLITDPVNGVCIVPPKRPGDSCNPELAPCPSGDDTLDCTLDGIGVDYYCKCPDDKFTDFFNHQCVPLPSEAGDRCDPFEIETTCEDAPNTVCMAEGSDVSNYTCQCRPGEYFQDGSDCLLFPQRPNGHCVDSGHCVRVPNTECVNKKCQCKPGFDLTSDELQCSRKAVYVDDPCDTQAQCSDLANTTCGGGKCKCVSGTVVSDGRQKCVEIVKFLGGGCSENVQCSAGIGPNAQCALEGENSNRSCTCAEGFVGSGNRDKCLQIMSHNGPCEENQQCTPFLGEHSLCSPTKKCECFGYAGYLNSKCYLKLGINMPCTSSEECQLGANHAYCNVQSDNPICLCDENTFVADGACYYELHIGDPCESQKDCEISIPNSQCDPVLGECSCPFGQGPSFMGDRCNAAVNLHFPNVFSLLLISIVGYLLY